MPPDKNVLETVPALINSRESANFCPRQQELIRLASQGKTDKEISIILNLSPHTLRTYWDRLRERVGASSRTQAVALALEHQLINASDRFRDFQEIASSMRPNQAVALNGRLIYVGSAFSVLLGVGCDDIAEFDHRVRESTRGDFRICEVDPQISSTPQSLKSIVDHVEEVGWIASKEGFIEYCNPWWSPYSGIDEEQFWGAGCALIIHPEDAAAGAARWTHAEVTGKGYRAEVRFRHVSGDFRHFDISVQPMYGPSGTIEHWVGTGRSLLS